METYQEIEDLSGVSVSEGIRWLDPEDFEGMHTYQVVEISVTDTKWGNRARLKLFEATAGEHVYVSSWNLAMNEATKKGLKKGSKINLSKRDAKRLTCSLA